MTNSTLPALPDTAAMPQTTGRTWALRAYRILIVLMSAAVSLQVFFAGAMIFAGFAWRGAHVTLGYWLGLIPLLLFIASLAARRPRADTGLTILLVVMTQLQPMMAYAREFYPLISAFHPVNAMLLFALPIIMFRRAKQPAA
jgi:hypothetical protein